MNLADFPGDYSTQKISPNLVSRIIDVLKNKAYGSVEIYIENFNVVQITERTITKLAKPKAVNRRFSLKDSRSSFSSRSQKAE
ncbi:hypothetical protein A3G14_00160 [Candidatus Curtissbacteria bacterium RIFCSPLOWO2_12_FULL_38_9]|uniref:DUF2292 domain-containing protein n=1 Tax=Candidatus Curtissbacteria bacterium RIFCSPLOWO2_12_FULL_38_9 TaxID=1797735 RepID=A0A1F5I884_9BACT|nr:MAG: hypothetical protein A3G14_00160 [Candidatus Curtissbacteria bacterium RIFCSPLOWO2_12_FULL_38_9]